MTDKPYCQFKLNEKFILSFFWIAYLADFFFKHDYQISTLLVHFVMTLNYVLLILFINYILLPRYFYRGKLFSFFSLSLLGLFITAFIEENVLEKIFFPDTIGNEPVSFKATLWEIGDFFLYIFLGVGFKIAWDSLENQKALERIAKEKLKSELQFLKMQISPHMLFNCLNNIYSYTLHNSPKAPGLILKLSGIMRYLLYEANGQVVPLNTELAVLKDYIDLQESALEDRGNVNHSHLDSGSGYFIAPFILISLVENCFKHTMNSHIKDITILVHSEIKEGIFTFTTENNYTPKLSTIQESGVGLQNITRRLELLYPGKYTLHNEVIDEKYKMKLTINLL